MGQSLSNDGFCTFLFCLFLFVTRLTYPGFSFVITWFISDLISFSHLLGGSFHLISLQKLCLYSSHCLCYQMSRWFHFRDFGDQGRIGESNCGYGVNFVVLNWYGRKLCWEVLHCNTRKDKLNVLLFFTPVSMSWCDHVNHNCNQNISFSFQDNGSLINVKILVHLLQMIQNSSEWDCELDALRQWTVGWSHWSWRKGKATVTTEMTRRSNLLYLEVYNTNVCLRLFQ